MNAEVKRTASGGFVYTVDAIPEDEERQDELNRRLRKPGEAACAPSDSGNANGRPKSPDAATAQSSNG